MKYVTHLQAVYSTLSPGPLGVPITKEEEFSFKIEFTLISCKISVN